MPVPGFGAGDYSPEGNLVKYIDGLYLPGRVMRNGWHPEGILGTVPAIATCLFGTLMGDLLIRKSPAQIDTSLLFVIIGLCSITLAWVWHDYLPINKQMWTPSFAVLSVGWGCVSVGLVYQITEVWESTSWAGFLVALGRHPLFAYVALPLMRLDVVARRMVGGEVGQLFGQCQPLVMATVQMTCAVGLVMWFDSLQRRSVIGSRVV